MARSTARRPRRFSSCSPAQSCCWSAMDKKQKWNASAQAPETRQRMDESTSPASQSIEVPIDAAGQRLDQFLAAHLEGVSRSRVQMLMDQGDVLVNSQREKASMKLRGGEQIVITGEARPAPLKATAEDIP